MKFARLKVLLAASLTAIAVSASAAERVTAAQLEQLLQAAHGRPEGDILRQLGRLELAERLSQGSLARCESELPYPAARQQLQALADVASFLDLPGEDVPAEPAPSLSLQRSMLALTVQYVTTTMHQLPNFSATRITTSFQNGIDKPWSLSRRSSVKVLYRKGEEVLEKSGNSEATAPQGLVTSGEFGPVLGTILLDAAQSNLSWSHWEQVDDGRRAVFRFSVPVTKSHYELGFCCVVSLDRLPAPYRAYSAYHGELAIDPANGTILRLVMRADLKTSDPLTRADLFVEYGPVEIAGRTYICPVRSAAYSVGGWSGLGTWLNDVVFEQYHVFGATVRIVPGDH